MASGRAADGEPGVTRIIAGFGRSGTTWVQDVLAEANQLRPVFEPLHPSFVPGAAAYAHRYLTASDAAPELQGLLNTYIWGEFWSLWSDYRIVRRRLYPRPRHFVSWQAFREQLHFYRESLQSFRAYHPQRRRPQRIVKLVRGNMMLGWLRAHFDARIVFLIRHPAAVIASQMKAVRTWDPYPQLEVYKKDERLVDALDTPLREFLFGKVPAVEAYALSWCIENRIALDQARELDIPVVCYETMLEEGEPQWRRVLAALALEKMPSAELVEKPSQQAWGDKAHDRKLVRQYGLWMTLMDDAVAKSIQSVLDLSGMDMYSVDAALPHGAPVPEKGSAQ